MNENCKLFEEDLVAYSDKELDTGRLEEVAAHIQGCADCRAIVDGLTATGQLIEAARPADLPMGEAFVDGLERKIRGSNVVRPAASFGGWVALAAAAAVLIAVGVFFVLKSGETDNYNQPNSPKFVQNTPSVPDLPDNPFDDSPDLKPDRMAMPDSTSPPEVAPDRKPAPREYKPQIDPSKFMDDDPIKERVPPTTNKVIPKSPTPRPVIVKKPVPSVPVPPKLPKQPEDAFARLTDEEIQLLAYMDIIEDFELLEDEEEIDSYGDDIEDILELLEEAS